jgi:hypothetical protein
VGKNKQEKAQPAAQEDDVGRALAIVQAKLVQKPKDAALLYLQAEESSQAQQAFSWPCVRRSRLLLCSRA